jgi:hypothetical protein
MGASTQRWTARYDPADFGLSVEALRERFRFYSERFEVLTP